MYKRQALSFLEFNNLIKDNSRFINFGLAGATEDIEIKSILLINQIKDFASSTNYHPEILFKTNLKQAKLSTFDYPVKKTNHPELKNTLVDMEASAIFYAANKWLTSDRIHLIKVASDHLDPTEFKANKPQELANMAFIKVKDLITSFLHEIESYQQQDWSSSKEVQLLTTDLRLSCLLYTSPSPRD